MLLGTRNVSRTRAVVTVICASCGHPGPHAVRDVSARLVLFDVPTVPVGPTDAVLQCRACHVCSPLSPEYADRLVADDATARGNDR